MIAVLGHVLVMYEIDELEDPYCLANLLAFSQTWAVRQPDLDGDLIELNIKLGLPDQTKPETKISLKHYLPEFVCAIQMGLGRRVQPIYPDTA